MLQRLPERQFRRLGKRSLKFLGRQRWLDRPSYRLERLPTHKLPPQLNLRTEAAGPEPPLANRVVNEVVTGPVNQRALDPSCGSGTFVFYADAGSSALPRKLAYR
jgi:hypothetical protein